MTINHSRFEKTLKSFLSKIERAGNALPHPAILFVLMTGLILVVSWVVHKAGLEATHPIKKDVIGSVNLLSKTGLHLILTEMVKTFTGFAPLGTVLVAMLGFSVAEKSGLISAIMRVLVLRSPRCLIVPSVLLAGILSHTAGDLGYVLLIPLSAILFQSVGMNPLAGIATSFAGVSGGFAANFLLSTADPLLGGLSQEAARIIDPNYVVTPVANWIFMSSSSLLIIAIGTVVSNMITQPFVGEYRGEAVAGQLEKLSSNEQIGLRWAGITAVVLTGLVLWGILPKDGFLRDSSGDVLQSPLIRGVVAVIFLYGALTGIAYGLGAKTIRTSKDIVNAMQEAMATMAPYIVLAFFAAQFISLFNASNMGIILAVHGSEILKGWNVGGIPLMIGFIVLTCILDIFLGSASAKWALMAPVFVPMFMLLGYSPELTQASYRIGDSVVNIISPLMSYFPMVLALLNKYDKKAGVGTLVALMLPYSVCFFLFWSVLLFVWMTFEFPLGPGTQLWYINHH